MHMVAHMAWASAIYRISPTMAKIMRFLIPPQVRKDTLCHMMSSRAKILARMDRGEGERRDFCSYVFDLKDEMGLTEWSMTGYANILIMAGSETSATVLSAVTYFLCRNPRVYDKLKKEVRSRYTSSMEITSQTATFPYLTAVIHEVLRIFPSVPFGMPRITPQ